jgi:SAM-dependent methyltransferase
MWFSSRKLRLPIARSALVLEVGSGDSPCPRSDVLCDMSLEGNERVGGKTVHDRPLVLGQVEKLPFKDKAFDFVIAFHVLEHSRDPAAFLSELERVAKAGYIETPSLWAEHVQPLTMHRLEVGLEQAGLRSRLVIRKKTAARPDGLLADQFQALIRRKPGLEKLHPESWVTRYFWQGAIDYRVVNPGDAISWETPKEDAAFKAHNPRSFVRRLFVKAMRALAPKRPIDLASLLRCPDCAHSPLVINPGVLTCGGCNAQFPRIGGAPVLFPTPGASKQARPVR